MLVLPSLPAPCHGTGAADRASTLRSRISPIAPPAINVRAPSPPLHAIKRSSLKSPQLAPELSAPNFPGLPHTPFHVLATLQVSLEPHTLLPEHRLQGKLCLTYALRELCPHTISNGDKVKIVGELEEAVAEQGEEIDEAGYRARIYRVSGYMMSSYGVAVLTDLVNGRASADEVVRLAVRK